MRKLICLAVVLPAPAALAHGDAAAGLRWSFDPYIVVPLLACLALYAGGVARLWRRGRRLALATMAYAAGWLALAGALTSPLHRLGEQLFAAHMVEHEIVMVVAAPLLVLGRPMAMALWAFPYGARRPLARAARRWPLHGVWRTLTQPAVATLLHGAAIWLWHMPGLFDAAIFDTGLHRAQHLSFLISALLFWWAMLRRASPLMAVADLFVTMIHTGLLGALLTFAPRVLYAAQTSSAAQYGLTPLEDQQLAGLVMWVPGGIAYAGAALAILASWLVVARRRGEARDALA